MEKKAHPFSIVLSPARSAAISLEKKTHTTSFLECDLAEDWEALPEFSDEKKTYLDFKSRLFDLYNLNIPRYNICDLKRLVSGHFGSALDLLTHSRHQEGDMCRT